jgi:hypothetical protein
MDGAGRASHDIVVAGELRDIKTDFVAGQTLGVVNLRGSRFFH